MVKNYVIRIPWLIILVVGLIAASDYVEAGTGTVSFNYDVVFSGDTPGGTSPYVTAVFNDSAAASGWDVRLTMSAGNLVADVESVEQWYFNLDPMLDPTLLEFNAVDVSDANPENGKGNNGIFTNDPSTSGDDASFKADGDGIYDILFNFPPPPGQFEERFTDDEVVIYDIRYTGGTITATSFNYFSEDDISGGQGRYLAAVHIQKTQGSQGSGWVGVVPEPVSSTLFIIGAATLGFRQFRKKIM